MNTRRLLTLLLTIAGASAAEDATPLPNDPSSTPVPSLTQENQYAERARILVDLDDDGDQDLLLSLSLEMAGTSGNQWTVYLNHDGHYASLGEISAHPRAISFEADHDRLLRHPTKQIHTRIWTYSKSSGSEGLLGYYRVSSHAVSEPSFLTIYPGDGGTDLGRALYRATFDTSPIPFVLEFSKTSPKGEVTWIKTER